MALTAGRKIQERPDKQYGWPLAAGATVQQGSLAMLVAGAIAPAAPQATSAAAAAVLVVGVVARVAPPAPAHPPPVLPLRKGTFLFANSPGADAITLSAVGQPAYAVDDETVALTSSSSLRPRAGTIVDVESDGVWVRVHP